MKSYRLSKEQIIEHYKTNEEAGLSQKEAQARLKKYGLNELPEKPQEKWFTVFLRQFQSPLIYILLIAAIIIFFIGPDSLDAFIISSVIFFNAIIGTIQEGRTRSILYSLKRFITTESVVIRDDKKEIVIDKKLVPGDIIILQSGERVAADARIVESYNLCVDEAVLTGESANVRKYADLIDHDVPLAEQHNMVFKGTYVLSGSGKAVVVATGLKTEIGKIHQTVEEIQTPMPLKKELYRVSHWILLFILLICIILFFAGLITGRPMRELLVMLTALFICVVPEGLPVVLTLVLVAGVYRMAKQRVLVKHMQAVEALGRTDVIVVDKTGTLTRNEMMVSHVFADNRVCTVSGEGYKPEGSLFCEEKKVEFLADNSTLMHMGKAALLLNNSEVSLSSDTGTFVVVGEPTEAALAIFARKLGLTEGELEEKYEKLYEIPFDSRLKYHVGFYRTNNTVISFLTGAPETIMDRSESVGDDAKNVLNSFLEEGLRVVAFGMKVLKYDQMPSNDESNEKQFHFFEHLIRKDIHFLGFCAIQDAIRPEVRSVIEQARSAGLKIVMATGDHKKTALYVAKSVGIFRPGDEIVNGREFEQASNHLLAKKLYNVTVYSRVSPKDKLRIIKQFRRHGDIVAMTGDGINDAPALVAADLGIAMGRIGSEIAKEAADIILLDDSFVHIIDAVKQGRHIFYTLRRVILYFFATNMGEILIVLFALGSTFFMKPLPLPITAAQILWLNLVTDGFLDVALSMEPMEEDLLAQSWLSQKLSLVDKNTILKMFYMAIPMAIGSLLLFNHYYPTNLNHARTMTLITMAIFQWFNAWNCRSERYSIFQLGFFANKWLILATLFVLFLQFFMVYSPIMQAIFKTVPLSFTDWTVIFVVASSVIVLDEVRKWFVRRLYPSGLTVFQKNDKI